MREVQSPPTSPCFGFTHCYIGQRKHQHGQRFCIALQALNRANEVSESLGMAQTNTAGKTSHLLHLHAGTAHPAEHRLPNWQVIFLSNSREGHTQGISWWASVPRKLNKISQQPWTFQSSLNLPGTMTKASLPTCQNAWEERLPRVLSVFLVASALVLSEGDQQGMWVCAGHPKVGSCFLKTFNINSVTEGYSFFLLPILDWIRPRLVKRSHSPSFKSHGTTSTVLSKLGYDWDFQGVEGSQEPHSYENPVGMGYMDASEILPCCLNSGHQKGVFLKGTIKSCWHLTSENERKGGLSYEAVGACYMANSELVEGSIFSELI